MSRAVSEEKTKCTYQSLLIREQSRATNATWIDCQTGHFTSATVTLPELQVSYFLLAKYFPLVQTVLCKWHTDDSEKIMRHVGFLVQISALGIMSVQIDLTIG